MTQPLITLQAEAPDVLVVTTIAVGMQGGGELEVSEASPPSEAIRFVPALRWPSQTHFALHCATCENLQVGSSSDPALRYDTPAYPAPWRVVGVDVVAPRVGLEVVWQNEDNGDLHVVGFSQPLVSPIAAVSGLSPTHPAKLAQLDTEPLREILVREDAGATLGIWRVNGDSLTRLAGVATPPAWELVETADVDGDGREELWWQTDVPGRVVIWRLHSSGTRANFGSVDTTGSGELAAVADFGGDGQLDVLWRDPVGRLTISHLEGSGASMMASDVELPFTVGDWNLEVRGAAPLDRGEAAEILVQDMWTYRVTAIFAHGVESAIRAPLFDTTGRYELVETW